MCETRVEVWSARSDYRAHQPGRAMLAGRFAPLLWLLPGRWNATHHRHQAHQHSTRPALKPVLERLPPSLQALRPRLFLLRCQSLSQPGRWTACPQTPAPWHRPAHQTRLVWVPVQLARRSHPLARARCRVQSAPRTLLLRPLQPLARAHARAVHQPAA